MAVPSFPFKGWRLAGTIVSMILAALLYGINWPRKELAAQFAAPVFNYLAAEQTRRVQAAYSPNGAATLARDQLQQLAEASTAARNITVNSLEVRGTVSTAVARVDFSVDGRTPPDGRSIRYLLLKNSYVGGWFVDRGSTVLDYYFSF